MSKNTFDYNGSKINYTREGKGKSLVFLHGWGADLGSFNVLTDTLKQTYDIIAIDFPGFGNSPEPSFAWNLDNYTEMTLELLNALNLSSPVLIGHSFGGRVAIKLSQKMVIDRMILINSAGIKPKRHWHYYFKVYGYKLFKTVANLPVMRFILKEPLEAYRELYSSSDYKQASPVMKQVLSKVVNEDLRHILKSIEVPVLLIWGDQDASTPLSDAQLMASLIPDAGLVVYDGVGHFSYVEQPSRTIAIINSFVGGR